MSAQQDQKKEILANTILTAIIEHKREQELALTMLKSSEEIVSQSIQLAAQLNVDGLGSASAGLSFVSQGLGIIAFFRAINDFLKGDEFSLSRLDKKTALGVIAGLALIGMVIPPLGAAMAIAGSAIGFAMSCYQLAHHSYEKFTNAREVKRLTTELNHLDQDAAEDGKRLNYILTESKKPLSPEHEAELNAELVKIASRQSERETKRLEIKPDIEKALIKKAELSHSATIKRCVIVLGAAFGIAAAIVVLVNPFTASILGMAAALTSAGLAARIGFKYFKEKWQARKQSTQSNEQPAAAESIQNSDEIIKESIQLHQSADMNKAESKTEHLNTSPIVTLPVETPTDRSYNEHLSSQEQICEDIKERLAAEKEDSEVLKEPLLTKPLFIAPAETKQLKKTASADDDELETDNENALDRD